MAGTHGMEKELARALAAGRGAVEPVEHLEAVRGAGLAQALFGMSRRAKRGKRIPGCAALFEGEVERPLPIGSVAITNQIAGSSALPGPIRKSSRWCVPESEAQTRTAFERSALRWPWVTYDWR